MTCSLSIQGYDYQMLFYYFLNPSANKRGMHLYCSLHDTCISSHFKGESVWSWVKFHPPFNKIDDKKGIEWGQSLSQDKKLLLYSYSLLIPSLIWHFIVWAHLFKPCAVSCLAYASPMGCFREITSFQVRSWSNVWAPSNCVLLYHDPLCLWQFAIL